MSEGTRALTAIVLSIVGLAGIAVIFSQRANTATVIQTSGTALSDSILAATLPVRA